MTSNLDNLKNEYNHTILQEINYDLERQRQRLERLEEVIADQNKRLDILFRQHIADEKRTMTFNL